MLHGPIDYQADRPTLSKCIKLQGRVGEINISQKIGVNYHQFCVFLLEDDNAVRIRSIAHKHKNDAEQINMEILEEWIKGRGKQPVTWKTLADVLHSIELNTLAGDIEAVKIVPIIY